MCGQSKRTVAAETVHVRMETVFQIVYEELDWYSIRQPLQSSEAYMHRSIFRQWFR